MFLEAGKHVLVEYPMALSAKAAHELWEMAEQKGNAFILQGVNSIITCWVGPKASDSKAGLQSAINHDVQGVCLSQRCGNLGFKMRASGEINTQISMLRVRYVCPHKSTGLCL